MTYQITIGTSSPSSPDCLVAVHTLRKHSSVPLDIKFTYKHSDVLSRQKDVNQTTEWGYTRFLTPHMWGYKGVSLYMDADFLWCCDIKLLFDALDPKYAVQMVQHDYTPQSVRKYVGPTAELQHSYNRKNWSSLILFNNELCEPLYNIDVLEGINGLHLHGFHNIPPSLIGNLPKEFNVLVGEQNQSDTPKALHFTNGIPLYTSKNTEYDLLWLASYDEMWKSEPISKVEEKNPCSMAWCFDNRYSLSSTDTDIINVHEALNQRGFSNINTAYDIPDVPICHDMKHLTTVQYRISDISIPTSYVTPANMFTTGQPWNVVLWVIDPYNTAQSRSSLTSMRFISEQYREKDVKYMPKSYGIDLIEVGWIAYDIIDNAIFIHHNQIPGILRGLLTPNEQLWMYRYMLRSFCAAQSNKMIFMVESLTYDKYMHETACGTNLPYTPFSRHVAKGSGFTVKRWHDVVSACPSIEQACNIPNFVPQSDIKFWQYDQ